MKTFYYISFAGENTAELSFSSQAQYLLINQASVSWLSDKVVDDLDFKKDTAVHRFRGNIIVEGSDAFNETQWKHVRIGNNNFKVRTFLLIDPRCVATVHFTNYHR